MPVREKQWILTMPCEKHPRQLFSHGRSANRRGCNTVEVYEKEDLFEEADNIYRHAKVAEISEIVIDGIDLVNGTCRISASIGSKHIKSVEVEDEHFAALADRIGQNDKHECFIPIAVKALINHVIMDPIDYENRGWAAGSLP